MKTTVEINDRTMAKARKMCAKHGMSLKSLLEKALDEKLVQLETTLPWQFTTDYAVTGTGVHPALAHLDMQTIIDMEEHDANSAIQAWSEISTKSTVSKNGLVNVD